MLRIFEVGFAEENVERDDLDVAPHENIDQESVDIPFEGKSAQGGNVVVVEIEDDDVGVGRDLSAQLILHIMKSLLELVHRPGGDPKKKERQDDHSAYDDVFP